MISSQLRAHVCLAAILVLGLFPGCTSVPSGGGGGGEIGKPPPQDECDADADCDDGRICDNGTCECDTEATTQAPWLVVVGQADEPETWVFATSFPVASDILATNAHVVAAIKEVYSHSYRPAAIAIEHNTGEVRQITGICQHPAYETDREAIGHTPDVGLLQIDEVVQCPLQVADIAVLEDLQVFAEITYCGFHGETLFEYDFPPNITDLLEVHSGDVPVVATCHQGTVAAIRPCNEASDQLENCWLIEYDLPATPGTSGSAVCNSDYQVIGLNSSGFAGVDLNFAVRANLLTELLDKVEQQEVEWQSLDDPGPFYPRDGFWTGTTSQGRDIRFLVSENGTTVSNIVFSYQASNVLCSITGTTTWGLSYPIEGASFSATVGAEWSSSYVSVSGSFGDEVQAHGEADLSEDDYTCGAYSVSTDWTASWEADKPECRTDADCDDDLFCNGQEECWGLVCEEGEDPCDYGVDCDEKNDRCGECDIDADCDDGQFCNGLEDCSRHSCEAGMSPCQGPDLCDDEEDVCKCQTHEDCSWGELCDTATGACVEDTCDADADCDDGLFCNGQEECSWLDTCEAGTGPCRDAAFCDEDRDVCTCQTDDDCHWDELCDAGTGTCAQNTCDIDEECDDGLFCNGQEECSWSDTCEAGTPPCQDPELCDENQDVCTCETDGDCGTGEVCDTDIGTCAPDTCDTDDDCDDNLFCNGQEQCWGGACTAPWSLPCNDWSEECNEETDSCEPRPDCSTNADCDDGAFCNGIETCVSGFCQDGQSPCSDSQACDDSVNMCIECWSDYFCSDEMFCNGVEVCAEHTCRPGAPPCDPGQVCDEDGNRCDTIPVAVDQDFLIEQDTTEYPITLVANDEDPYSLTYTIVTEPASGSLTGTADGDEIIYYTTSPGLTGQDSFTFRANDGTSDSSVATVSIAISAGWEVIASPEVHPNGSGLAAVGNSLYLIAGAACYEYSPSTPFWQPKESMETERYWLGTAVAQGHVYAIGGGEALSGQNPVSVVEKYDPSGDTWTSAPSMNLARSRMGAATLNGKIYVFGGYDGSGQLRSIEILDPSAGLWTYSDDMVPETYLSIEGTSAVALNGKFYVFGFRQYYDPWLWQYDPSAAVGERWVSLLSPDCPGDSGAKPNVAAAGTWLSYMPKVSSGEPVLVLFDTTARRWSDSVSPMHHHADGISAVLDGYLYAIGGESAMEAEHLYIGQ